MTIKTPDGLDIYCLPDCARCRLADASPEEMDECPMKREHCVPEVCEEYTED